MAEDAMAVDAMAEDVEAEARAEVTLMMVHLCMRMKRLGLAQHTLENMVDLDDDKQSMLATAWVYHNLVS